MTTSQIVIGAGMRPCGACGAYVPELDCEHWKPGREDSDRKRRQRNAEAQTRRRARKKAELEQVRRDVEAFRTMMQGGRK